MPLRGSPLNPFGRTGERRQEREPVADYERTVAHIPNRLNDDRLETAVALPRLPEMIRGHGPVKQGSMVQARARRKELMGAFDQPLAEKTKAV